MDLVNGISMLKSMSSLKVACLLSWSMRRTPNVHVLWNTHIYMYITCMSLQANRVFRLGGVNTQQRVRMAFSSDTYLNEGPEQDSVQKRNFIGLSDVNYGKLYENY